MIKKWLKFPDDSGSFPYFWPFWKWSFRGHFGQNEPFWRAKQVLGFGQFGAWSAEFGTEAGKMGQNGRKSAILAEWLGKMVKSAIFKNGRFEPFSSGPSGSGLAEGWTGYE